MPWVDQALCTGCGACVAECPVDAISVEPRRNGVAAVDDAECIRCGRCHDVCPQGAVRHDSERIPQEIVENLQWVRTLLAHFGDPREQSAFMQRMLRFFNKQKKVSEHTLAAIAAAAEEPAAGIDAAIREFSKTRPNALSKQQ